MLDINFYRKFCEYFNSLDPEADYTADEIMGGVERLRSSDPVVYNIETTNRCNMRCKMCPRTTMMTRKNEDINRETFLNVVDQIRPHTEDEWSQWKTFCENTYGIQEDIELEKGPKGEMSENHFFLYVIPKVIQLHGYGDPLLDMHMAEYVSILHDRGFYSYFSCNPANINLERTYQMLDAGLDYIKYSIESVDDAEHKKIRGEASNFTESYKKIQEVLKYKEAHNLGTTIVITMLDLNRSHQKEDFDKLLDAFKDLDVYIYLKSEDCQWYRKDFHGTKSIHWSEVCKHPWMTMTIKSNGEATMCMEDFNNEIILGDTNTQSLREIWNGEAYRKFRYQHLYAKDRIKCVNECDMKLMGDCFHIS